MCCVEQPRRLVQIIIINNVVRGRYSGLEKVDRQRGHITLWSRELFQKLSTLGRFGGGWGEVWRQRCSIAAIRIFIIVRPISLNGCGERTHIGFGAPDLSSDLRFQEIRN